MARATNKVTVTVRINGELEYEYERMMESEEATYTLTEGVQAAVLNLSGEWMEGVEVT